VPLVVALLNQALDLFEPLGMQSLERQVVQFHLEAVHAQPAGQR
jgi:hypothetical protein